MAHGTQPADPEGGGSVICEDAGDVTDDAGKGWMAGIAAVS